MDLIVTTPKSEMANAAQEAAEVIRDGGGAYFRALGERMPNARPGDRIFYVEDGYVRGFCVIAMFGTHGENRCSTTGRVWKSTVIVNMDASSWKWIRPIPMRGFQGWRYFTPPPDMEIIGDWLDPKPAIPGPPKPCLAQSEQPTELGFAT